MALRGDARPGSGPSWASGSPAVWGDLCWRELPICDNTPLVIYPLGTPGTELGRRSPPHKGPQPVVELWLPRSAGNHLIWGSGCPLRNTPDTKKGDEGSQEQCQTWRTSLCNGQQGCLEPGAGVLASLLAPAGEALFFRVLSTFFCLYLPHPLPHAHCWGHLWQLDSISAPVIWLLELNAKMPCLSFSRVLGSGPAVSLETLS